MAVPVDKLLGQRRKESEGMDKEQFESLTINLGKKVFELNGKPMKGISCLELSFENGNWSLMTTRDILFDASDHPIKEEQEARGKNITLEEWLKITKHPVRVCEGLEQIPKVMVVGIMGEDQTIETHVRLVAASEWKGFQETWRRVSGINCLDDKNQLPRTEPQFFLICN